MNFVLEQALLFRLVDYVNRVFFRDIEIHVPKAPAPKESRTRLGSLGERKGRKISCRQDVGREQAKARQGRRATKLADGDKARKEKG